MFLNRSTAQVLAGLGTVASGLGITWRSAAGAMGRLSLDIGRPLWSAELDVAIASRVTPVPQRDHVGELGKGSPAQTTTATSAAPATSDEPANRSPERSDEEPTTNS